MGCGASAANKDPPRQLVLLGGGECGKTTIFKQIQILHGTGFKDSAAEWMPAIHKSPLRSMKVLLAKLCDSGKLDGLDDDDKVFSIPSPPSCPSPLSRPPHTPHSATPPNKTPTLDNPSPPQPEIPCRHIRRPNGVGMQPGKTTAVHSTRVPPR